MDNKKQVREFFGKHAAAYTASPGHRAGEDLQRLIELLAPQGTEALLDVATATGNTALALAPLVAQVTGVDLTPEMGREFAAQAERRGVSNARFVQGDAEHLPFADDSFDIVTCRRAAHHFPGVARAVAEMYRVLRGGGRLGLVDMTAPEDRDAAELLNRMERARDRSHGRALSPEQWRATVAAAGFRLEQLEVVAEEMDLARWLAPVKADGPEAAAAAALAEQAPPAVAKQVVRRRADGGLTFLKRRVVLLAVKPA